MVNENKVRQDQIIQELRRELQNATDVSSQQNQSIQELRRELQNATDVSEELKVTVDKQGEVIQVLGRELKNATDVAKDQAKMIHDLTHSLTEARHIIGNLTLTQNKNLEEIRDNSQQIKDLTCSSVCGGEINLTTSNISSLHTKLSGLESNLQQEVATCAANISNLKTELKHQIDVHNINMSHIQKYLSIFENGAKAFLAKSTVYRSHTYVLSNRRQANTIHQAQAMCQIIGGYLAEVNDVNEFKFVQNFARQHTPCL